MGILASILETVGGKVHFMVLIDRKPALELFLKDKELIVEIKNPVLAIDFGIQELFGGGKSKRNIFRQIKKLGYKVKIKYKMLELDI